MIGDLEGADLRSVSRARATSLDPGPGFVQRIESILWVASRYDTGVRLAEVASLTPPDTPLDEAGLRAWFAARPHLARVEGDRVFSATTRPEDLDDRRARADRYRQAAEALLHETLAPVLPLTLCVGITGSTAYGEPKPGDDLDFFVVTRRGALWVFVLFTQLVARLRLRPWPAPERPRPCFNYVLEDGLASPEFERPRGFVVAREALNTVVIRGESYYQGLLGAGIWMREEVPRLYVTRSPMPPRSPEPPAAWPVRLASALIFPFAAAYLHLKTIYNNALVRRGDPDLSEMVAQPALHRFAMLTYRFESLRRRYGDPYLDSRLTPTNSV